MPRALLFDFNGVLLDDEHLHWRALKEALAPCGVSLPRGVYDARYLAFDDRTAIAAVMRDHRVAPRRALVEEITRTKQLNYRRIAAKEVRIEPEVRRFVRSLARVIPIAIVSGAAHDTLSF